MRKEGEPSVCSRYRVAKTLMTVFGLGLGALSHRAEPSKTQLFEAGDKRMR